MWLIARPEEEKKCAVAPLQDFEEHMDGYVPFAQIHSPLAISCN
jgi:hypothetical protein